MKIQASLTIASLALALTSGAAKATEVAVSYNYTAHLGVFPSDDPASGNQFTATGNVYQVVNIDSGAFRIDTPTSTLIDVTGSSPFVELAATDTAGDFSFAVDLSVPSDPTNYGTFAFSAGFGDVQDDSTVFNGGGIYTPGGIGYDDPDGFSNNPTFSVTGSVTFAEVSTVPLPASAPMFGAALLGLAGLGFAARRKAKLTV